MLWLLLYLVPLAGCSRGVGRYDGTAEQHSHDEISSSMRPHIYYCRSPNMEDFTCWWHPMNNLTEGEDVTYILTYSREKEPKRECPDYVTAGPNSCHFDRSHTSVWHVYCMNVTAVTAHRNYTSDEHCLDVADIVQTDAPVNLTYKLKDAGGDERGHNVLLSWDYPEPDHVQHGWITLLYELQYRRVNEPDNWKVKNPMRETHVELLGLPIGGYEVRVRCRSKNSGLWSKWSTPLTMSIPMKQPAGRLLVLIVVTGVGVMALLVIAFGIIPQSKRIKEYILPPIPKPRIIGIDPLLLKRGSFDAINRHFSNFHSYRPPSYTEEVWDQVSADDVRLATPKDCSLTANALGRPEDALIVSCNQTSVGAHHPFMAQGLNMQSLAPYCPLNAEVFQPPMDVPPPWLRAEVMLVPGTDYSMMGNPGLPAVPTPDLTITNHSPQDFYTCVQLMNETGEVHLVPCLPPAYSQDYYADTEEKKKKLADYQERRNAAKDEGNTEKNETTVPLLPVCVSNRD